MDMQKKMEKIKRIKATQTEDNSLGMIVQCCVCHRYLANTGDYIAVSDVEEFIYKEYYRVSHSYCPSCTIPIMERIKKHSKDMIDE